MVKALALLSTILLGCAFEAADPEPEPTPYVDPVYDCTLVVEGETILATYTDVPTEVTSAGSSVEEKACDTMRRWLEWPEAACTATCDPISD